MNTSNQTRKRKLVVAPPPTDSAIIPSIYSVTVEEKERVEWRWLQLPDGNRVVIDYQIVSQITTN